MPKKKDQINKKLMKRLSTLEIYNLIAIVLILILSFLCYNLYKDLKDTEEVLQQCENRYYETINKQ